MKEPWRFDEQLRKNVVFTPRHRHPFSSTPLRSIGPDGPTRITFTDRGEGKTLMTVALSESLTKTSREKRYEKTCAEAGKMV